jgi:transcriptional regulator with XRE-family HTH domain
MHEPKIVVTAGSSACSLLLPMVTDGPVEKLPPKFPEFGDRVTRLLRGAGLTNPDAAGVIGVTPEMVRRYAEGYAMPRPDTLAKLAKLLGVSPGELQWGMPQEEARDIAKPLSADERALLELYGQLPEAAKKALRARATELWEAFGRPNLPAAVGTQ